MFLLICMIRSQDIRRYIHHPKIIHFDDLEVFESNIAHLIALLVWTAKRGYLSELNNIDFALIWKHQWEPKWNILVVRSDMVIYIIWQGRVFEAVCKCQAILGKSIDRTDHIVSPSWRSTSLRWQGTYITTNGTVCPPSGMSLRHSKINICIYLIILCA